MLYARGAEADVRRMASECRLSLPAEGVRSGDMRFYDVGIAEIVLMPSSSVAGRTVADIGFRTQFRVNVVGAAARVSSVPISAVCRSTAAMCCLCRGRGRQ